MVSGRFLIIGLLSSTCLFASVAHAQESLQPDELGGLERLPCRVREALCRPRQHLHERHAGLGVTSCECALGKCRAGSGGGDA